MRIGKKIRTLFRVLQKLGVAAVFRLLHAKFVSLGKDAAPQAFDPSGLDVRSSSLEVMKEIFVTEEKSIDIYALEFKEYIKGFEINLKSPRSTFFGEIFDLGQNMALFLYLWVRLCHPNLIVETGVAAGASTNTLLSAIGKNQSGRLASIDITSRVGELVESKYKNSWSLHVINPKDGINELHQILKLHSEATLFLHDSDHSVEWQIVEFEAALKFLPNYSLIAFDDVSNELINHVNLNYPNMKIVVFDENRKFSAVFLKG